MKRRRREEEGGGGERGREGKHTSVAIKSGSPAKTSISKYRYWACMVLSLFTIVLNFGFFYSLSASASSLQSEIVLENLHLAKLDL